MLNYKGKREVKKMNVRKGISFITAFGIIVAIICALLIGFSLGQFAKPTEIATASYYSYYNNYYPNIYFHNYYYYERNNYNYYITYTNYKPYNY
jgi:hypothetical protein